MADPIVLKMKDATARSDKDLCPSCAYVYERKGQSFNDTKRICGATSSAAGRAVNGRVTDCTSYYPKALPNLGMMNEIAWEVTAKGDEGNRRVGFISPEDRRKAGIGPSPIPTRRDY